MSKKTIEGITKIAVKSFKSIAEECAIDIRPLTILAGANSSGKSSIIQPLLMLKQTLEAPYDPGPLLLDGPNVQFTEASQFLSKLTDEKRADHFQVSIGIGMDGVSRLVGMTFRRGENGFEIGKMTVENELLHLVLYPEMPIEVIRGGGKQYLYDKKYIAKRFLHCSLYLRSEESRESRFVADHEHYIFHSIHLPGLRGNPERIYKLTSTGPRYPGTFENYIASILHEWHETKDKRLKTVADALHTLGLTGKVGTKKIGDVGIELQVGPLPHDRTDEVDTVNITDVGLGVSQVLPVLVALIAAEPGRLVYIEQPELHLHPRAQVALAQVLADAAKRGVRVVAETHSSLLLLGVQTLVAEGDLSPELVKLHWFTRREDGITEVDSVDLDEAGTYGEWPIDFDDVSLNVQSRFLDAVDNVRFGDKETS
ncbi:AAA family ATPase [Candidatus Poribacteria bacterium]|nr:AAA family ATPase [Candidatus Poribacteria bacterium]MYH81194.1 AAA family ATPase [Candidatus Poribacteria bacterium]MYK95742.1 AAA family ATPase [Candidatus Poribacteria bacterium]